MQWFLKWLAAGVAAVLVGGCGGAGSPFGGGDTCVSHDIQASFNYGMGLAGNVGSPVSVSPVIRGVPDACAGAMRFRLRSGTLPPGVTLDANTGVLSGTPTTAGVYWIDIVLRVEEFEGSLGSGMQAYIGDPSSYTFGGWDLMSGTAPLGEELRLGVIGTTLYGVTLSGAHVIDTYASSDGGATWTQVPVAGPPGALREFAVSSDGTFLHLSGGVDSTFAPTNEVWRFDGTAWSRMTAAAAFQPRQGHAMVSHGGALYVLGGRTRGPTGPVFVDDTWKSTDSGATWTLVSASGFRPRVQFCAVSAGTHLYVMGSGTIGGGSVPGNVWRSPDGTSWTPVPVSATSPLVAAVGTNSGSCAYLDGRIHVVGSGFQMNGQSNTVSSADGALWNFEPQSDHLVEMAPSAAVLDGRIHVAGRSSTLPHTVVRSRR